MDLRRWILDDHAGLAARVTSSVMDLVPRDRWRERPGGGSSLTHLVWHTAWHADLAVHAVVQDAPTVRSSWDERLGLGGLERHRGLSEAEDVALTDTVDLPALEAYASAVHDRIHAWLATTDLAVLDQVPPAGPRLTSAGVDEAAVPWLHAMWAGKPVAWFVQWEALGHRHGHLGEAIALRNRLGLSPF